MKILVQSDLHLDSNKKYVKEIYQRYIKWLNTRKEEILIIVGDISNYHKHTIRVLDRIKEETNKKVYFVLGNHDVWDEKDSWLAYYEMRNEETILVNQTVELNEEWVLVGGFSWYDYTMKPTYMNKEEVSLHKPNLWRDAMYAKWGQTDEEFSKEMMNNLKQEVEKNKDKKIILANHFVPKDDFLIFKTDEMWNVANAFMGTLELEKLMKKNKNIKYNLFGHTHKRMDAEIEKQKYICVPLGYKGEWVQSNFEKELEKASYTIEI